MEEAKLAAASAIALAVTLFTIFWLRPLARKLGLVDRPGGRKAHRGRVPLVGGLCFFVGTVAGLVYLGYVDRFVASLFVPCVLLVATGAVDDLNNLSVRSRLVIQAATAILVVAATGVYLDHAGQLFGESELPLGLLGIPITIVAVIGLVNAFNMLDGIDGLAAGSAMVSIGGILLFASSWPLLGVVMLLQVLFAALVPYLCVNLGWPDGRKVFMGDAGSTLIGFVLAWSLIFLSRREVGMLAPVDTLWCVALPVIDTLAVMQRRIRAGSSPFSPDRQHLHHLLLDAGCPPRQALAIILLGASLLAVIGYGLRDAPELVSLGAFGAVMLAYMLRLPQALIWLHGAIARAHPEVAAQAESSLHVLPLPLAAEPRPGVVRALCVLADTPDAEQIAPVARQLAQDARFDARVCVAGPADANPGQVMRLFDLHPDVELPVTARDMTGLTSAAMDGIDQVLSDFHPDVVLVPGDAATTAATTLAAYYQQIPVACIEAAGKPTAERSPEEAGRKVALSLATLHFTPNEKAGRSLVAEGVPADRVVVAGDPGVRTMRAAVERIAADEALRESLAQRFGFLRPERRLLLAVSHERMGERLEPLARALRMLALRQPELDVVCLTEPSRAMDGIDGVLAVHPNIHVVARGDFLEFAYLLDAADLVLAASEAAGMECARLGKPVLLLNRENDPHTGDGPNVRRIDINERTITDVVLNLLTDRDAYDRLRVVLPADDSPDACERIADALAALRPAGAAAEPGIAPVEAAPPVYAGVERVRQLS